VDDARGQAEAVAQGGYDRKTSSVGMGSWLANYSMLHHELKKIPSATHQPYVPSVPVPGAMFEVDTASMWPLVGV
jgi:hypothetical protein